MHVHLLDTDEAFAANKARPQPAHRLGIRAAGSGGTGAALQMESVPEDADASSTRDLLWRSHNLSTRLKNDYVKDFKAPQFSCLSCIETFIIIH